MQIVQLSETDALALSLGRILLQGISAASKLDQVSNELEKIKQEVEKLKEPTEKLPSTRKR